MDVDVCKWTQFYQWMFWVWCLWCQCQHIYERCEFANAAIHTHAINNKKHEYVEFLMKHGLHNIYVVKSELKPWP